MRDSAGKARWVALRAGEVDLLGQLQALRENGDTGIVTMANHNTPTGGTKDGGVRKSFRALQRLGRVT